MVYTPSPGMLWWLNIKMQSPIPNFSMSRYEKWQHDRNLDEIVDRLAELLVSIMLMSVKQINEQYLPLKKRLDANQTDDGDF